VGVGVVSAHRDSMSTVRSRRAVARGDMVQALVLHGMGARSEFQWEEAVARHQ
jgi:hypothetical protein